METHEIDFPFDSTESTEISFPFDSTETLEGYDRLYYSQHFADFFRQFIGNGVYGKNGGNLQILSIDNNMFLSVNPGAAFINGRGYMSKENKVIRVPNSNVSFSRIDNVVCRLNMIDRLITVQVVEGEAKASPVPPKLERDADLYDLKIAEIYVRNGTDRIAQSDITDCRPNSEMCGWVTGLVDQINATEFFRQYQLIFDAFMDQLLVDKNKILNDFNTEFRNFMNSSDSEFSKFMTRIIDILDENVAGNLLRMIDKNTSSIESLKTLPKFENIVFSSTLWSTTKPSIYTLVDSRYSALASYWEFTIPNNAVEAQMEAFENAEIELDGSIDGVIKFVATGSKPTIDLPVLLKIEK